MKRLAAAAVVVLCLSGCSKEPEAKAVPAPAASALPSPLDAARGIYADLTKAPKTYALLPHLSRFYVEDNQRKDKACMAGEKLASCDGDRVVCLQRPPTRPGRVTSATLNGEQPGVSATALLGLEFGAEKSNVEVDVVWEDGAWKIDQVRCPAPAAQ